MVRTLGNKLHTRAQHTVTPLSHLHAPAATTQPKQLAGLPTWTDKYIVTKLGDKWASPNLASHDVTPYPHHQRPHTTFTANSLTVVTNAEQKAKEEAKNKSHKKGRTLGLDFHLELPCPPVNHPPEPRSDPKPGRDQPSSERKTKVCQPSKQQLKSPVSLHCAPSVYVESNVYNATRYSSTFALLYAMLKILGYDGRTCNTLPQIPNSSSSMPLTLIIGRSSQSTPKNMDPRNDNSDGTYVSSQIIALARGRIATCEEHACIPATISRMPAHPPPCACAGLAKEIGLSSTRSYDLQ
ncbi:hypothetical protein CCUS01_03975 [Colletotrichum cuscutae]|uniref:Uncharacterized protein n=1 Tax=Colletotrichum cuscutae TaxID=1209917 RepID=A0AAI9Y732_9PEZI|nr:hypothetical protein CCUS01_03975 [Colletotrichum cuscutae]